LAKFLKSCNTEHVGTTKINRQAMLKKMKESKLQKGKVTGNHSSPQCTLRWSDKKYDNDLNLPYS
jgi:hypothetical protein